MTRRNPRSSTRSTPTGSTWAALCCAVWATFTVVVVMGTPSVAEAAVELELTEIRSAELPIEASGAIFASTDDGRTVVANTTGGSDDPACTVFVVDGESATSYEYRNGPTACVGVLPHPDGGFFLRTVDPTADPMADPPIPAGATVRIDGDGNEVWSLDDRALVDAAPESESGTGEFLGQYGGPVPLMAYSATFDKLLAFTDGVLNIGGGSRLTQAHVVDADDGELRESGQTFGEDAGGTLAALTTRETDGYFVLAIFRSGTAGANFYTYNGRSSIDFFRPVGEEWDERDVRGIRYDQQGNFYILWLGSQGESPTANLTAAGPDESKLWSESYDANVQLGGSQVSIGEPLGFWVGSRYVVNLHTAENSLVLRVVDVLDGSDLGAAQLEPPGGFTPLTILNGEQQRLKLVTLDQENSRLVEFEIGLSEGDGGGDPGGADAGDGGGGGGGGCGCHSSPGGAIPFGALSLLALGLLTTRLRTQRQP